MRPYAGDMDFAYFAVRLGWSLSQYEEATPVQLACVWKEIERDVVDSSELMAQAMEIALANDRRKRRARYRLWKRRAGKADVPITDGEMAAISELFSKHAPWSPWKGASHG